MATRLVKISYWTGIPLLFSLILIILPFGASLFEYSDYYFSFNKYSKINLKVDSLVVMTQDAGTVQVWGLTNFNNKLIQINYGKYYWATDYEWDPIIDLYKEKNKYLNVWYWEKSKQAYFVEPNLKEMTFKTVWLPDVKRLTIVIVFYLFHAYCQRVRKKYEKENTVKNDGE